MILEILQYVTSGFWIFVGSCIFTFYTIIAIGWSLAEIIKSLRGK